VTKCFRQLPTVLATFYFLNRSEEALFAKRFKPKIMIHQVNIAIHAVLGTIAIVIGLFAIIYNRKVALHKKLGRYFVYLLTVVVSTGFIGFFFFRQDPFLLMLTLIATYVGFAGFRNIKLRENRSTIWDAAVALGSLMIASIYLWKLVNSQTHWNVSVVSSTFVALGLVTTYDLVKFFFLHNYLKKWWLYEHIYKMISAFSALLSAFSGNVLRDFHPYSQVVPSAFCTVMIGYFIFKRAMGAKQKMG
jgi:uncharacterized membrane protein HdeD (DUF308 family)